MGIKAPEAVCLPPCREARSSGGGRRLLTSTANEGSAGWERSLHQGKVWGGWAGASPPVAGPPACFTYTVEVHDIGRPQREVAEKETELVLCSREQRVQEEDEGPMLGLDLVSPHQHLFKMVF